MKCSACDQGLRVGSSLRMRAEEGPGEIGPETQKVSRLFSNSSQAGAAGKPKGKEIPPICQSVIAAQSQAGGYTEIS